MTSIQQITRATPANGAAYEALLGAIGTDRFGSTVRDAIVQVISGARRVYLFEASDRIDHRLHYYSCEPGLEQLLPLYTRTYLALDPVGDAYRAAPRVRDTICQRILPSDIASHGFRRRFFDEPGIVERISIVQRAADAWRVLSVSRHRSDGYVADRDLHALIDLAALALPMLPLNRGGPRRGPPVTILQLEDRFAAHHPQLTMRERQACARAAIGMTVEATARDLGIARTSVLTYRQRAYRRLGVTSPHQLCALVSA